MLDHDASLLTSRSGSSPAQFGGGRQHIVRWVCWKIPQVDCHPIASVGKVVFLLQQFWTKLNVSFGR